MKHGNAPAIFNFIPPTIFGLRLFTALFFLNLGACSRSSETLPPPPGVDQAQSRAALNPASAFNVLTGESAGGDSSPAESANGCRSDQPLGASLAEIARNAHHTEELNDSSSSFSDTFLDWVFGGGLGRTAVNVGTVVVFPPYAIYMFGNAGIALAGFEPLYITDALPDQARTGVLSAYDEVTSLPGRMNAAVMRQKFCSTLPAAAGTGAAGNKGAEDRLKPAALEGR